MVDEVVDLAGQIHGDRLTWDFPAGRWKILRFSYTLMADREYDVDILDAGRNQALRSDVPPGPGGCWAAGRQDAHPFLQRQLGRRFPTWTLELRAAFQRLRLFLAVVPAGPGRLTVQSSDVSERFLRDYHRTLSDCFHETATARWEAVPRGRAEMAF